MEQRNSESVSVGVARQSVSRLSASLLDPCDRTEKPRRDGITIVLDNGQLGPNAISDIAFNSGDFWDYAKIAWGSALITRRLAEKLECYRAHGVTPLLGGTLFEYAYLHGKVPALLELARRQRVHIEISDGVISLPRADKLRWIEAFARHVEVFSEVGGKIERQSRDWRQVIREELSAGAHRVVVEGREIAPVGEEIRTDFLDAVLAAADPSVLVFEALERRQQVFLIKHLGPNVNLANILPGDLLTLESFRLGLKEHTLLHTFKRRSEPPPRPVPAAAPSTP